MTVEGLFAQYWMMDLDVVPKDSNMECTCLSLALDKAKELLAENECKTYSRTERSRS